MSPRGLGILLAVLGVVCFSVRPVLVKLVYAHGVDPTTLLALRLGLAAPAFAAVALWSGLRGRGPAIAGRDWATMVALGLVGQYVASWFDMAGLVHVDAGLGRLILFLYPTVVVVLSALFLRSPITRREFAALALSYAGLALVLLPRGGGGSDVPYGAMLIFTGATCYAVYLVAGSRVIGRVGAMRFSAYATLFAFAASCVHFLATHPLSALDLPSPVWLYAGIIASVSTVLPIFAVAEALRRIGANHVALIGAVGPVSTVTLGHLGLGETLSGLSFAGAILILSGVLIVTVKPAKPAA